jgi:predicted Ser/Thr protein kinase
MSKSEKFLKIASGHKKRKKKEKFAGTYSEYLGILEEDKDVAKLAHRRLYDVLSRDHPYGGIRWALRQAIWRRLFTNI